MKKSICRAFAIAFAVSIMLTTVIPASAAQPPVIMPAYVGITDLFSGLTISSNGKASCKATAYNNGTHDVTLTIALKQDGSTIKSWDVVTTDGFNSVEKNYFVTSGHSYQVVVADAVIHQSGQLGIRLVNEPQHLCAVALGQTNRIHDLRGGAGHRGENHKGSRAHTLIACGAILCGVGGESIHVGVLLEIAARCATSRTASRGRNEKSRHLPHRKAVPSAICGGPFYDHAE